MDEEQAKQIEVQNKYQIEIDKQVQMVVEELKQIRIQNEKEAEEKKKEIEIEAKRKKDLATSYWNSLSMEEKKDLLTIKISDLKAHSSSSPEINQVISEAVSWYETNKTWKYWHCCKCNHKFADRESFRLHLFTDHLGTLTPQMQSLMPVAVDKRWSELLLECPWEPLDASATAQTLARKKDGESPYVASNDPVRKELLGKIQGAFELFLRHKCLSESTLHYVIRLTMRELEGLPIGSHILSEALDETPLCICFLGPTTLTKILEFLNAISQSCGIAAAEVGGDEKKGKQSSKAEVGSTSH